MCAWRISLTSKSPARRKTPCSKVQALNREFTHGHHTTEKAHKAREKTASGIDAVPAWQREPRWAKSWQPKNRTTLFLLKDLQQVHAEQPSVRDAWLPKSSELSGSKNKYGEINIQLDGNLGKNRKLGVVPRSDRTETSEARQRYVIKTQS